ncbi:hypothetical protein GW17_00013891 [Ensete ventricosum]|nr:hypothetical protein GW17_00013891 [Ensete ventricosum]
MYKQKTENEREKHLVWGPVFIGRGDWRGKRAKKRPPPAMGLRRGRLSVGDAVRHQVANPLKGLGAERCRIADDAATAFRVFSPHRRHGDSGRSRTQKPEGSRSNRDSEEDQEGRSRTTRYGESEERRGEANKKKREQVESGRVARDPVSMFVNLFVFRAGKSWGFLRDGTPPGQVTPFVHKTRSWRETHVTVTNRRETEGGKISLHVARRMVDQRINPGPRPGTCR